ncbi:PEGA domain-containing protein [Aestuariicella hydrocarbonica]|uniref:PEGA domain-containing protein n=1 Tax=Pseudomaricurvus hydrocarbonicus TaxID=1470433 RepID=A0A9E5JRK3_9GAMM|nr:PEGA domain-containing protein [Aestuariicella hydrocarbonica]NHO64039.1 PEGA domain-containing protein [Aestuariicella hydrocarbonica]
MTQQEEIPDINERSDSPMADDDIIQPLDFEPAQPRQHSPGWKPSSLSVTVGIASLVTLLVLAYLFAAKSLYIRTNTEQPAISVDGLLTLNVGERFLLLKGPHQVNIQADGYYPYSETLQINSDDNQYHDIDLKPLPGHLTVISNTPAQISVDGTPLGASGERLQNIAAGDHLLSAQADRYQPLEQPITIEGLDKDQSLTIELQPDWANVDITSTPAGASVFSDGAEIGTTPLTAELLTGKHDLMVKLAGYKAWRQSLRVKAQEAETLPHITLVKADGLVDVVSKPAGASVTVNGQFRGKTPVEIALSPGKTYNFTLFKDGYSPQHRKVSVTSGKEASLSVNLTADLGNISISATPADALLYVDDRLMGRANQNLTLPARKHRIRISKEGYADHTQTVLARQDLDQNLTIRLLTNEEYKWKNIKPTLHTAAKQKLLLFKPDHTFTMGASRREQGRRANEAQRTVKLDRAFYLSEKLVTNAEYRRFEKFHTSGHVKGNSLNGEQYPVVNVTWQKAALYCNWLSAQDNLPPFYQVTGGVVSGFNSESNGYRLPTEAEWSWAARLSGNKMMKYSWGENLPPAKGSGNFGDRQAAALLGAILVSYDDGFAVTSPVGKFPPNHHKLYDISGNAAEWINDYYGIETGLSLKAKVNPMGPDSGDYHVIRGSSWANATMTDLRLSFRDYGTEARNDLGFRIARFID